MSLTNLSINTEVKADMILDGDVRIVTQGNFLLTQGIIKPESNRKWRLMTNLPFPSFKWWWQPQPNKIQKQRMKKTSLAPQVWEKQFLRIITHRKSDKWENNPVM